MKIIKVENFIGQVIECVALSEYRELESASADMAFQKVEMHKDLNRCLEFIAALEPSVLPENHRTRRRELLKDPSNG